MLCCPFQDENMIGWIKIHRQIREWTFCKGQPFTWGQAWLDLLLLANHEEGNICVRGNIIPIKRGQVGWSMQRLQKEWGRSQFWVIRFLTMLETSGQIELQKNNLSSVITIINYEKYQMKREQTDEQTDEQKGHRPMTNKKDKKIKNDKNLEYMSDSETELTEFVRVCSVVFGHEKRMTKDARKKYAIRRGVYGADQLLTAFKNLLNEPDGWKLKNNGFRPLAWWLHNDERIEEMLTCHLKVS